MSKKRKTLRQKQKTDLRKVTVTQTAPPSSTPDKPHSYSIAAPTESTERASAPARTVTLSHAYVWTDVKKTLIITSLLILLNIGVYYLFSQNIISLSQIGL